MSTNPIMEKTTTKPTPGPWSVDVSERLRGQENRLIRGADRILVAQAEDFNEFSRDPEVDANARLIAAAPDLLEALGEMLVQREELGDMLNSVDYPVSEAQETEFVRITEKASTAIKKARGQS